MVKLLVLAAVVASNILEAQVASSYIKNILNIAVGEINQFQFFTIESSQIIGFLGFKKIVDKVFEFLILFITSPFENGNTIFDLEAERVDQVVNNGHIFEISVLDDSKILDVETILGLQTEVSVKNIADIFLFGVKLLNNGLSISLSGGSEYQNFKVFLHYLEEFLGKWSDLDHNWWGLFGAFRNKNFIRVISHGAG